MEHGALAPYERALDAGGGRLGLRLADGSHVMLDVARWLAPVDAVDAAVLDRCHGPVLDVGSGPGRFVGELVRRGFDALGVDIAAAAVELTVRRGLPTVHGSVFDDIPGEGRWHTVLLMDGNVGIGGDPDRLLRRLAAVQPAGGLLLVETDDDPDTLEHIRVRFTDGGHVLGPEFDWARVGAQALVDLAGPIGYDVVEFWSQAGRNFVALSVTAHQ